MQLTELASLADQVIRYAPESDLTGTIADALRGEAGLKLWQTSKKWYRQKVADLDVPVNATLQRAIRRSYLTSLGQTCDQAIVFIRTYQAESESLSGYRARLQALYHKLKRVLPVLLTFPVSDEAYQIQLIESIRTHLTREIERVATLETLPDNPADTVFDQLILWDYTLDLNERQLRLQDEVHRFVLDELRVVRALEVPKALETLLLLGWMRQGHHQTFFELMFRNFSEEIKHTEGVSEIFNAKLLAMLHEQMTALVEGMKRMEDRLTTLPAEVAKEVVARIATLNFDIFESHNQLNARIQALDDASAEATQKKQKHEQKLAVLDDEELRELLSETLQELNTKLLDLSQQRNELQKELTEFEDKVCTLALNLYSAISPDSPRLLEARRLFEQGDLEGANLALNPDDLERDKALVQKAEAFLEQKKQTLAQEYLTKAQLLALDKNNLNWFADARYYYTEAVAIYESYDSCSSTAYFLQVQNQHSQSILYYELVLNYIADDAQKALTLNNLAALYQITQQLAQAEQEFTNALNIYRTLAQADPQLYLSHLATALNNLANLHKNTQQLERAEDEYQEALDIYRSLAQTQPQVYLPYEATTLNNLGVLYFDMQKLECAEQEYQKALEIRRKLAQANPQAYLPNLATTLNNLGLLHSNTQHPDWAEQEYQEALNIYRKLVQVNPQVYLPYVAGTLHNLANLHVATLQLALAEDEYQKALDIRRNLAQVNPTAFQISLARTLVSLGRFYQYSVLFKEKSLTYAREAYTNAKPYSAEVPLARIICNDAIKIWQEWGKDLVKHMESKQGEG